MNEPEPPVEAAPLSDSGRRISTKARRALFVAVVVVGGLVAAALVWRPWIQDDAAEAESTDCIEDATHIIDDEHGVCYIIPDDWAQLTPEQAAEQDRESLEGMVHAPRFAAFVTVRTVDNAKTEAEDAARKDVAAWTGVDPDSASIESVTGAVDGHDSAIASGARESLWLMVTAVEEGDSMIVMQGTIAISDDAELIEQITSIHSSLRLK